MQKASCKAQGYIPTNLLTSVLFLPPGEGQLPAPWRSEYGRSPSQERNRAIAYPLLYLLAEVFHRVGIQGQPVLAPMRKETAVWELTGRLPVQGMWKRQRYQYKFLWEYELAIYIKTLRGACPSAHWFHFQKFILMRISARFHLWRYLSRQKIGT